MTTGISDDKRESIIEDLRNDAGTQAEIAENHDVSQSTVSNINRGLNAGKKDGYREGVKESFNFGNKDETEVDDDDEYWCQYCQSENDEKVFVEYMTDECPNGHNLTGDWPDQ